MAVARSVSTISVEGSAPVAISMDRQRELAGNPGVLSVADVNTIVRASGSDDPSLIHNRFNNSSWSTSNDAD